MQLNVKAFVILAAVLAGGCEQIKSLKNVHELEGKVDELTKQVAELQGKGSAAGSAEPKKDAKDAKGEHGEKTAAKTEEKPEARPDDRKAEEKPEAKADDKHEAKDEKPEAKPDAHDHEKEEAKAEAKPDAEKPVPAMGPADASGKTATADPPPAPDTGITSDPAFEKLLNVVAENSARAHPNNPGGTHWSYNQPAGWADLDPAWKACRDGKVQSPIDIEPRASSAKPIVFHYKPTAATVVDNGHTLQVNLAPGNTIEIGDAVYDLVQFHFHTPSEHTIAGEHFPLEVHLVHKDSAGKLAVIGVLYDSGPESRPLAGVWSAWPRKPNVEGKLAKPFDPSALLPETRTVFRYTGSLTTPPCTEGVVWNVMRRTLSDSKAHLDAFGAHYAHNSRDLQALNDRKIE